MKNDQEKKIWENIDLLYKRLEEGEATKDDLKKVNVISRIIRRVTASKNSKGNITKSNLYELIEHDRKFFHKELGLNILVNQNQKPRNLWTGRGRYIWPGIAAAILLVFGISSLFYYNSQNINNEMAVNITHCVNDSLIHLPDGTTVQLASGSSIAIAKDFGNKERKVTLMGEAFFEVTKNPAKAFIVQTKTLNAIVHGTSFNVVAYDGLKISQVSVRTGCVEVTDNNRSFGKLHPGDRASYDGQTHKVSYAKVDPDNIGTWRNGAFILENASVDEFAFRIHSRFGYEIVISNNCIPNEAYINYSSYNSQTGIQSIIQSICNVYGAKSKIDGNKVVIYP